MEDEPTTPGSVATQAGGHRKLNRWIGCVNDKCQSSELKDSYFHHRFQKKMTYQLLELVGWDFQVCQEGLKSIFQKALSIASTSQWKHDIFVPFHFQFLPLAM